MNESFLRSKMELPFCLFLLTCHVASTQSSYMTDAGLPSADLLHQVDSANHFSEPSQLLDFLRQGIEVQNPKKKCTY